MIRNERRIEIQERAKKNKVIETHSQKQQNLNPDMEKRRTEQNQYTDRIYRPNF